MMNNLYFLNITLLSSKAAEDSDARFRIRLTFKLLVVCEQAFCLW